MVLYTASCSKDQNYPLNTHHFLTILKLKKTLKLNCHSVVFKERARLLKVFWALLASKNWMKQVNNGAKNLFEKCRVNGCERNQLYRANLGQVKRKRGWNQYKSTHHTWKHGAGFHANSHSIATFPSGHSYVIHISWELEESSTHGSSVVLGCCNWQLPLIFSSQLCHALSPVSESLWITELLCMGGGGDITERN